MKKALLIIGAVVVVMAIAVVCLGIYVVRTPEYALLKISMDVKADGIDGLRPHLTEPAQQKLDTATSLAENKFVGKLMDLIGQGDYVEVLTTQLQQVQWELRDIMKGNDKAQVTLGFNYRGRLVGTIEITMIRDDDGWKIDGLELPKFEQVSWEQL